MDGGDSKGIEYKIRAFVCMADSFSARYNVAINRTLSAKSPTALLSSSSQSLSASDRSISREEETLTIGFAIGKFSDFLLWFMWVLEIMMLLHFMLRLVGSDPNNPFIGFLYNLTDILTYPFLGIVPSPSIHSPNQAFEFSTLIAMAVYFLFFYALRVFLRIVIRGPEEPPR